jgi:hypothetical protein
MPNASGDHLRGVLSILIAVAAFCFMDSSMKLLAPHYLPMQVAALRGITSLPLVLVWALVDGGPSQLIRVRWPLHLVRGVLSVIMLVAFVYGINRLPLAEAYSLFFVAPLLITALAGPILRESIGWRRWAAIAVGLCGTIIVLRPSGAGMLSLGGLAIIVSAMGYALSAITVRVLGRTDSTQSMVVWMLSDAERVLARARVARVGAGRCCALEADRRARARRRDRAVAHHRGVPPRAGVADRAARIHGAVLGRAGRLVAVEYAAGSHDAARRGGHRRMRALSPACRARARRGGTSVTQAART